jgi:hypothetical protein
VWQGDGKEYLSQEKTNGSKCNEAGLQR